jgi:SAM-dependent methyltransferase
LPRENVGTSANAGAADAPGVLDYYAPSSLSAFFHDLLALNDPGLKGDTAFYAGLAPAAGAHFLDLGCGAGRIGFALVQKGFRITGIDISSAMLDLANTRRGRLPHPVADRIRFQLGDMTNLDLSQEFDAVIAPFYSFNHFEAVQRRAVIQVISRHLEPGARAAIHALPPDVFRPLTAEQTNSPVPVPFNRQGQKVRVRPLTRSLDRKRRQMITLMEYEVYEPDGRLLRSSQERLVHYWFDDEEIEKAARAADLHLIQNAAQFIPEAPMQKVFVFRRS